MNVIDLTDDPWTVNSTAPTHHKPTPLSPSFNPKPSIIAVPRDPKKTPAYIFQQLALNKNRANIHPSFSSTVRTAESDGDDSSEVGSDDKDNSPTPRQRRGKDQSKEGPTSEGKTINRGEHGKNQPKEAKPKDKSQNKKEKSKHIGAEEKKPTDSSKKKAKKEKAKPRAGADKQPATTKSRSEVKQEAVEVEGGKCTGMDTIPYDALHTDPGSPTAKFRKRKRSSEELDSETAEAKAVGKLRDSLPSNRISRVAKQLKQEIGRDPTELTVLLSAAKDTIIDLARQQVRQTEQSYQTIHAELVRMLKEQNEKLAMLEGRAAYFTGGDEENSDPDDDRSPRHKHKKSHGHRNNATPDPLRRRASTVGPFGQKKESTQAADCADQVQ